MMQRKISLLTGNAALKSRMPFIIYLFAGVILSGLLAPMPICAAPVELPPAVEKKVVSLSQKNRDAERFYANECGKCHRVPDVVKKDSVKTGCTKDLSNDQLNSVQNYIADVRTGKSLYESHCGRCHNLIDPESHSADYWSKNVCTSEECFVEKLREDEEQKLLLYLSSHAKK